MKKKYLTERDRLAMIIILEDALEGMRKKNPYGVIEDEMEKVMKVRSWLKETIYSI